MTILRKVKASPKRSKAITVTRMLCLTILLLGSVWSDLAWDHTLRDGEFLQGEQRLLSPSGAEVFLLSSTSLMSSFLSLFVTPQDIMQTPEEQIPGSQDSQTLDVTSQTLSSQYNNNLSQ